jgi:ketosteroid isomerase-like protein
VDRSPELQQLVVAWFEGASRGDTSLVDAHVSPGDGTCLIGSDPGEVFRGGSAVAQFLRSEVEGAGGRATFSPTDIEAFSEGTVGWATTNVTITMPDGRHVSPRWSAVFHMEDGVWKFVQTHASIGIANEDIGWEYPA